MPESPQHTWEDLAAKFKAYMLQCVALDKMRDSTRSRYEQTCKAFGEFLKSRAITDLNDISRAVVEDFKAGAGDEKEILAWGPWSIPRHRHPSPDFRSCG